MLYLVRVGIPEENENNDNCVRQSTNFTPYMVNSQETNLRLRIPSENTSISKSEKR